MFWTLHLSPDHSGLSWACQLRILGTGPALPGPQGKRVLENKWEVWLNTVHSCKFYPGLENSYPIDFFFPDLEGSLEITWSRLFIWISWLMVQPSLVPCSCSKTTPRLLAPSSKTTEWFSSVSSRGRILYGKQLSWDSKAQQMINIFYLWKRRGIAINKYAPNTKENKSSCEIWRIWAKGHRTGMKSSSVGDT